MTTTANPFATRPNRPVFLAKPVTEQGCPACGATWVHVHDALSIMTHSEDCSTLKAILDLTALYDY
jgi:hypothetical protein